MPGAGKRRPSRLSDVADGLSGAAGRAEVRGRAGDGGCSRASRNLTPGKANSIQAGGTRIRSAT